MTTATTTRDGLITELCRLMDAVGPSDLTDDEAAAIIAAVTPAWERKYRRFSADIVDLDLVRNHPTRNRT